MAACAAPVVAPRLVRGGGLRGPLGSMQQRGTWLWMPGAAEIELKTIHNQHHGDMEFSASPVTMSLSM